MVARNDTYEFARFGDDIVRRPVDSDAAWEPVPDDVDARVEAATAINVHEQIRQRVIDDRKAGRRGMILQVTRAPKNVALGERLGLGAGDKAADELASRLARSDDNRGSSVRLDEAEFDRAVVDAELGFDANEARDRLSGRFWQPPSPEDKSRNKAP